MFTHRVILMISLVCILSLAAGSLAQAGDPTPAPRMSGGNVSDRGGPLNTSAFPISLISNVSDHYHETHPSVAYNSGFMQNYLVVWQLPDGSGNSRIYEQLVNRDGTLNGSPLSIGGGTGLVSNPDVAYNAYLDQYLVVWDGSGSGLSGIEGVRISNTGHWVGTPFDITAGLTPTDTYSSPAIAYSPDRGQYLVTWTHTHGVFQGIEARTISDDGSSMGSVWELTGMLLSDPDEPDVAYTSPYDQFLVVWQKTAIPDPDHDIYGQRIQIGASPGPVGSVISIHSTTHDETSPSIAGIDKLTGIGQYLVVCQSDYGGTTFIDGQLVTDGGTLDGGPFYVSSLSGTAPSVAGNQLTQEYLAAWIHNPEVHARTFSTSATGGEIKQLSGNFPGDPAVASGPTGDFLIVDEDYLSGYPFDIFGYLWGTRLFMPAILKN